MDIQIHPPKDLTLAAQLEELREALLFFQTLRREEEHQLVIGKGGLGAVFSAALVSLIEQKRRDGYLIKVMSPEMLSSVVVGEIGKEKTSFDKLFVSLSPARKDLPNAFFYIIGELFDNIYEHARTPFGTAAFNSDGARFSLAVSDPGISIPGAYRGAGVAILDDCDALKKAMAGISSKTIEERGTGLPSVRRIVTEAFSGTLSLISANALLAAKAKDLTCDAGLFFWQGTIVVLEGIIPPKQINLYDYVE